MLHTLFLFTLWKFLYNFKKYACYLLNGGMKNLYILRLRDHSDPHPWEACFSSYQINSLSLFGYDCFLAGLIFSSQLSAWLGCLEKSLRIHSTTSSSWDLSDCWGIWSQPGNPSVPVIQWNLRDHLSIVTTCLFSQYLWQACIFAINFV